MIKPKESESAKEFCEKMKAKGYYASIREDNKIMLMMTKAFGDLVDKHGFPAVLNNGKIVNFHNMLVASFDWRLNGQGLGVVILDDKHNLTLSGL